MSRSLRSVLRATVAVLPLALCACGGSPVADGSTEPVDLAQFNESTDRFAVLGTLGEPAGSVTHEGRRCDIYKLYTSGLGAGGKAAVKPLEAAVKDEDAGVSKTAAESLARVQAALDSEKP